MDEEKGLVRSRSNSHNDVESSRHDSSALLRLSRKMMRAIYRGRWSRGSSPVSSQIPFADCGVVVGRKHLLILLILSAVVFVTHRSGRAIYHVQRPGSGSADQGSTIFHPTPQCATNETYDIPVPVAADKEYLTTLWHGLQKSFDANPPSPTHVEHLKLGNPEKGKNNDATTFPFSDQQAADTRRAHAAVVKDLPEYPRRTFKGRGLVMLGGGRYSEFAATSLNVLRAMGSKLPVELWLADANEETPYWCEELEREGMTCRRLSDYMDVGQLSHPYAWKVFTMLYSSFEEIMFLDADSMPMKDPDYLFDSEPYVKTGAILWPDYWDNTGSPWLPYVTGRYDAPSDDFLKQKSVESGQIVWNKQRHWKSLVLAAYYNYWGPDFYFTMINNGYAGWGDKDTFPVALQALGEEYHMVPTGLGTIFLSGTIDGIGMLQADPRVTDKLAPQFLHCNIIKWAARKFWCDDKCRVLGKYSIMPSHAVNEKSRINGQLHGSQRILKKDDMAKFGLDPEPYMWRAMEKAACRSRAWGEAEVCDRIRNYMVNTFGARFVPLGPENGLGPQNQMCLEMPEDPR